MFNLRLGLKRWRRSSPEVLITLFIALVLVISPLAAVAAQQLVKASVSDHWRGAYDVLVLAPDSPAVQSINGVPVIEPNYAAISSPAITADQVEQVAALDAVELAAPIGFLGRTDTQYEYAAVQLPESYLRENPLSVLAVDITYSLNDGLSQRYSSDNTLYWRIDARNWNGQPEYMEQDDTTLTVDFGGARGLSWVVQEGVFSVFLPNPPTPATVLAAVDPAAEAQLLGEKAPDALKELTAFEEAVRPLLNAEGRFATPLEELALEDPRLQKIEQAYPTFPESGAGRARYGWEAVFTPVITATGVYPPFRADGRVSQIQLDDLETDNWLTQAMVAERNHLFEIDRELSGDIKPFGESSYPLAAPGLEPQTTYGLPGGIQGTGISPLTVSPATAQGTGASPTEGSIDSATLPRVVAQGFRKSVSSNSFETIVDGTVAGQTSAYRNTNSDSALRIQNILTGPGTAAPFVVGTYNPEAISQHDSDTPAPLGAYATDRALRVSDGHGKMTTPQELPYPLTGLGLAAMPATAITTLNGARTMGIEEPVTAIRVRVSGVDRYDDDSIAKLHEVVHQIEGLGLSAHIVAGASPQDTRVWVDSYAFGVEGPRDPQKVALLGAVDLTFIALGVAGDLVATLSNLADGLSVSALTTTLGALLALALVRHRSRQQEMALLAAQGVGASARLAYLLAEAAPTLLVLFLGAAITFVMRNGSTGAIQVTPLACSVTALLLIVALASSALPSPRQGSSRPSHRSRFVKSWAGTGKLRHTLFPLGALMPLAIALVAVLVASSALHIPETMHALGTTALGKTVAEQTLPTFIALILLAVGAALALIAASWATQLPALAAASRLLWEQGYSPGKLRTRALGQWARLAAATMLLAALGWQALTWQMAGRLTGPELSAWATVAVALLAGALTLPIALLYVRHIAAIRRPARSSS